ncbi:unnamed protein product [Pylaiella littoralis]
MTIIRSCLSRQVRFGINQALRPNTTPLSPASAIPASTTTVASPLLGGPVGSLGGLVSRRQLRVTRTPPQTPPMPPMDLRYNYAAGVFIVVLFTWAALSPEDEGFNSLLCGGMGDDDDDDDDGDDERYGGAGYEGRDKALAAGSSGGGGGAGGREGGAAVARD